MNSFIKQNKVSLDDLSGMRSEGDIAKYGDHPVKRLTISAIIHDTGIATTLYTVYDYRDVPVLASHDIKTAISKYNGLPTTVGKIELESETNES